jgi:hypothetical protein
VSNTYDLQRAGWDIVADQDYREMAMRVMIRDPQSGMVGYTKVCDSHLYYMGMENGGRDRDRPRYYEPRHYNMTASEAHYRRMHENRYHGNRGPSLEFALLHDSTVIRYAERPRFDGAFADMDRYEPVDCVPQTIALEDLLHDAQVFATMQRVEEENQILAEPETVADLLDKIKKMQKPSQDEIRERMRKREKRENGVIIKPSAQLQAQILSFK